MLICIKEGEDQEFKRYKTEVDSRGTKKHLKMGFVSRHGPWDQAPIQSTATAKVYFLLVFL